MTRPSDDEIAQHLATTRARVLEATRRVRSPRTPTRLRAGIAAGALALGAIGVTGGTIVAVQSQDDVVESQVYCHDAANASSDRVGVDDHAQSRADIIAACAHEWRIGRIGQDTPPADPNDPSLNFPVPDLVACEGRDGVAAVFPREAAEVSDQGLCEALGLAVWDSD